MVLGSEEEVVALFKVTIRKEDVVAPVLPLQEHWLAMSNLDLLLPPLDVGVFFCYGRPAGDWAGSGRSAAQIAALKKALAQALVPYYAFAGEIVQNSAGEPEIRCDNRGVDFIEAFAGIELDQLNFYNPDESVEGKLVPKKKRGVFSVQATELKCGGLVVGCSFDHRAADAYSANMFLISWARAAAAPHSSGDHHLPSFRRSLLNPRRSYAVDPAFDRMYVPLTDLPPPPPPPPENNPPPPLISRIYYVEADRLAELQAAAGPRRTKFEAFSAFLWKAVARCSPETDSGKPCRIGVVVDGRSRLAAAGVPTEAYFGNVLSVPFTERTVGEVADIALEGLAEEVGRCVGSAASAEHFLGLVDFVEALRPVQAMTRIYSYRREEGPSFVVSSGRGFPVDDVDFGWGPPVFGTYHFPWGGDCGYVMPMPSPRGGGRDGDWVVYMHLFGWQLEAIEEQASHVFNPLTFDYLSK